MKSDRISKKEPPTVMVAVGTDHHPFDRLTEWIDAWSADNPDVSVLVQRGTSRSTAECPSVELLPHAELCENFATALVVVSHGGPSTVMDARAAGRLPIVMARDPEFGEHVDGHQMRFAEHLKTHDLAVVVDAEADLREAIDEALANPSHFAIPVERSSISGVVEFGRMLDDLLDTKTPMTPASPNDLDDLTGPAPVEAQTAPDSESLDESQDEPLERNTA